MRSTPASLQSPFPSPHATFFVLAWQALVRDLWSTLVVLYSLSHHLCALFNVCSQALDCASALDRVCRFQPLCLLMAARQTSIMTTTAPPAHSPRMWRPSQPCAPLQLLCFPLVSNSTHPNHIVVRTGHSCQGRNDRTPQSSRGDDCKLARTARHRLSFQNLRTKVARIFFRATANHVEMSFT